MHDGHLPLTKFFSFFHLRNRIKIYNLLDVIVKNKYKRSSHACCSWGVVSLGKGDAAAAATSVKRIDGASALVDSISLSITMATLVVYIV